jgi:hypothetical protein
MWFLSALGLFLAVLVCVAVAQRVYNWYIYGPPRGVPMPPSKIPVYGHTIEVRRLCGAGSHVSTQTRASFQPFALALSSSFYEAFFAIVGNRSSGTSEHGISYSRIGPASMEKSQALSLSKCPSRRAAIYTC